MQADFDLMLGNFESADTQQYTTTENDNTEPKSQTDVHNLIQDIDTQLADIDQLFTDLRNENMSDNSNPQGEA